jgi:hypothetical protein
MVIQGSRWACDLEVDGEDLKHTGNHAAILATNQGNPPGPEISDALQQKRELLRSFR